MLALGAGSFVTDVFKSLTQAKVKSSSPPATGFTQSATNPFDASSNTSTSAGPAPASGSTGVSQISPPTMNALLAAQSHSPPAKSTSASTSKTSPTPSIAPHALSSATDTNGERKTSKEARD